MGCKLLFLAACVVLSASRAVDDPPILNQWKKEVLFKLHEPVRLACGDGSLGLGDAKDIKFTWTKDGQPLKLNDLVLIPDNLKDNLYILQTKIDTEGIYQCFATSDYGVATSGPLRLKQSFIDIPKVEPKRLKPKEGEPLQLECPQVNAYPKPKIGWMFQHGVDPSISHTILDPRITTGPNGVLYFSNVTEEDVNKNFKYVCTATNPAVFQPVTLAEYYIEDLVKSDKIGFPRVPQFISNDMTVKEGDVTEIYCIYGGTPLIPPDWFFNGKPITGGPNDRVTEHNRSKGKRLLIRDTYLSDQGVYSCKITEEDGMVTTSTVELSVVSVPKFVVKSESKMIVKEGEDVTIPCQVSAVPDPKISWTFNGKLLNDGDSNGFYSIVKLKENNAKGGSTITANLIIRKVKESDKGYYGCMAANENGDIYAETVLLLKR